MKRDSHIINEIIKYENMYESFNSVLGGTKRKKTRQGRYLLAHKEEVIKELAEKIENGTFRIKDYRERDIIEGGKLRRIQILPMYDRIAIHAIMNIVDEHIRRRLIRTTSASIKARGMHDLMEYIKDDIKKDPEGTQYCYKMDIHHFYQSSNQDLVMKCVENVFKDKKLLAMLDNFARMMPSGISIGLRSSQSMGNLFLSAFLDHYIKDKCGVKHYYRYCDDIVILSKSKEYLWYVRNMIVSLTKKADLKVKSNERVFPTSEGIDFLGYVIYPSHVMLRKRNKKKAARKLSKVKSRRRRLELIASLYGMAKHANCNN